MVVLPPAHGREGHAQGLRQPFLGEPGAAAPTPDEVAGVRLARQGRKVRRFHGAQTRRCLIAYLCSGSARHGGGGCAREGARVKEKNEAEAPPFGHGPGRIAQNAQGAL